VIGEISSYIPVLKGGTLPSLLAQKLSAWYSAYSGVLLYSLLGLFLSILVVQITMSSK
jgi:hypothetical protein